jgi:hypothetical protein
MALTIYGATVVFAHYPVWQYKILNDSTYCHPVPFFTAFIMIIMQIV